MSENAAISKVVILQVPIYTAAKNNHREIARPMNKPFPWWK